jgi:hypothetical protein
MTQATIGTEAAGVGVLDAVAACLSDLAHTLEATALLESGAGRVLASTVVGDPPPYVLDVLIRGHLGPLRTCTSGWRTVGMLAGRPVLSAAVPGGDAVQVALAEGALWLLCSRASSLDLEVIDRSIRPLTALASLRTQQGCDDELTSFLSSTGPAAVPHRLRRHALRALLALTGPASELLGAHRPSSFVVASTTLGQLTVVVLGDRPGVPAGSFALAAEELSAGSRGVAVPVSRAEDLAAALRLAAAALPYAEPGMCTPLWQVRRRAVLTALQQGLASLPDLGADPVQALVEHDRRRHSTLATTLAAWLDAQGDSAEAARRLGVHPNTFRYRVRRAEEVAGVDLTDPVACLELQIRLPALLNRAD